MSFVNNVGYFYIDTPTYVSEHGGTGTVTFGDLFENCIVPAMKEYLSPDCFYFTIANGSTLYPCVSIPYKDGTCDESFYFIVRQSINDTIGTTYKTCAVECGGNAVGGFQYSYHINSSSSSGGNMNSTRKLAETGIAIRYICENEFVAYGMLFFSSSPITTWRITTPLIVTEMSDGAPYIFSTGGSTNYSRLNGYIVSGGAISRQFYPVSPGTKLTGCAILNKLDFGDYSNSDLYITTTLYSSLVGTWCTDNQRSLIISDDYKYSLWYENAFTINNQSFDVWIGSGNTYSSSSSVDKYALICRKHKD